MMEVNNGYTIHERIKNVTNAVVINTHGFSPFYVLGAASPVQIV